MSHDPPCIFCPINHYIEYATRKENCCLLRCPSLPENSVLLPLAVRHTKDHTIWNENITRLRFLSVRCCTPWIQSMERSAKPSTRNAMGSLTSCSVLRMYHASTAPQTRPCLGRGKAIITTTPAIHCGVDVACHSAYASEGLGASTSWSCVPINSMRTLSASVFLIPPRD